MEVTISTSLSYADATLAVRKDVFLYAPQREDGAKSPKIKKCARKVKKQFSKVLCANSCVSMWVHAMPAKIARKPGPKLRPCCPRRVPDRRSLETDVQCTKRMFLQTFCGFRHSASRILASHKPLSREGVVSSYSVIATGLCSRHRSEFGTLEHCRFAGLRPAALSIVGALKSLQNGI